MSGRSTERPSSTSTGAGRSPGTGPDGVYVVDYVRRLEEALIRTVHDYGLEPERVAGRSGVWLAADGRRPERKIVAVGIRVSRGTTQHGFGFNVAPDLGAFGRIVPCGISDAGVTSLSAELGRTVTVAEAATAVEPHLRDLLTFA
jgi:lipoyl(octanoyl) transferase